MPVDYAEEVVVTKYDGSGYYGLHWDTNDRMLPFHENHPARIATLLVYLREPDRRNAGHTVFPFADGDVASVGALERTLLAAQGGDLHHPRHVTAMPASALFPCFF